MWRVACLCAAAERTPSTALHPQSQHLPASHLRLKGRLLCKTRSAPSAPSSHSSIKGGASPLSRGCQPELHINHSLLGLDANIVMLHRWEHHCAVCDSNVSQRTAEHKCQDAHRQRCAGDTGGSTQQRGARWCPSCGRACAGLAPGSFGCQRPQATCTGPGRCIACPQQEQRLHRICTMRTVRECWRMLTTAVHAAGQLLLIFVQVSLQHEQCTWGRRRRCGQSAGRCSRHAAQQRPRSAAGSQPPPPL